jgi:hypothetical protein
MESNSAGKAWQLVEQVVKLHETLTQEVTPQANKVQPVAVDDMVFLAEKMFQAQEHFHRKGKPCQVDIGYHYTTPANMDKIRTDGLLSRAERKAINIQATFNGAAFGEGIYTGNDPTTFSKFGDVGLVVARLKGTEMDVSTAQKGYGRGNDSISGPQLAVLQHSCQCLALVQFPRSLVKKTAGCSWLIRDLQPKLQAIVDEFFSTVPN